MALETSRPPQLRTVGNYELIAKLAEGGMGAVYKGRHVTTGAIVAIKIVPPGPARNPVILRRFEQEFPRGPLARPPEHRQGASSTAAPARVAVPGHGVRRWRIARPEG